MEVENTGGSVKVEADDIDVKTEDKTRPGETSEPVTLLRDAFSKYCIAPF